MTKSIHARVIDQRATKGLIIVVMDSRISRKEGSAMEAIREAIRRWLGIDALEEEFDDHEEWASTHGHPHEHEAHIAEYHSTEITKADVEPDSGAPAPERGG